MQDIYLSFSILNVKHYSNAGIRKLRPFMEA